MANLSGGQPYRLLAQHYDQLFTFHQSWCRRARKRLLRKMLPRLASTCDLACGTGTTAIELARGGVKVFAVDLSPTMCRLARRKALRTRVPIHVLCGNMRTFRLPEPVDLVLCQFDSINHLTHKSDLAQVAGAVARALRPGGYFYFDVNNRLAFEKIWPRTWWIEKQRFVLVLRGGYDRRRDKGWINAEWFFRDGSRWRRVREHIEEVWWSPAEIHRALRMAGFDEIRAWNATPSLMGNAPIRPGCRTFYLAQKVPD